MIYPYSRIETYNQYYQIVSQHYALDLEYGMDASAIGMTIRYQKQLKRYEFCLAKFASPVHYYTVTKAGVYVLPDISEYMDKVATSFGLTVLNQTEVAEIFNCIERKSKITNLLQHDN